MKKDTIKSLIALRQNEIPFNIIERDCKLPINRNKIITIPGVRRCGKATLMELAINDLIASGVDIQRRKLPQEKITYYKEGTECDFVVQQDETVTQLIQVTWTMTDEDTRKREIKGLLDASKGTNCDNLLIITNDEKSTIEIDDKKIKVVPAWEWCLKK